MWYEPYCCYYPTKQTKLLKLWDEISLPHEKAKQEYGPVLCIIGFNVNPKLMRVSMDEEDRNRLLECVISSIATAIGGTYCTLWEFQQLAGWINWSFNIFPLFKPALSNVYVKISGKMESHTQIFVSRAVVCDLEWFVSKVNLSNGVYLFEDVDWDEGRADAVAYCDACLSGIGFFFEQSREGSQCSVPQRTPKDTISYFEALAVACVVDQATKSPSIPSRLLVFSDNTNTIDIFHSLWSLPPYNELLKFMVSLLLKHNISLRVVHVSGLDNSTANSLSRFDNAKAFALAPGIFSTPTCSIGAAVVMLEISSSSRQPRREAWTMEHLINECSITLGYSFDTSSFRTYTSALNLYLTFCNLHNLPADPTPNTLSFYAVFLSTHIKPDSVNSYLSGICRQLEPFFSEVCHNQNGMLVSCTMAGCMRRFGTPVKWKAPLLHANLLLIINNMVSEPSHDDLLFLALILTRFHALMRLGKLIFPDKKALRNC